MCSNMFDVINDAGDHCVILSEQAKAGFSKENLRTLSDHYTLVSTEISLVEKIGGGSCRCMLVELF